MDLKYLTHINFPSASLICYLFSSDIKHCCQNVLHNMLYIICHQGNANENKINYLLEWPKMQNTDNAKCWWRCGQELIVTAGGNAKQYSQFGTQLDSFLPKLAILLPCDPNLHSFVFTHYSKSLFPTHRHAFLLHLSDPKVI